MKIMIGKMKSRTLWIFGFICALMVTHTIKAIAQVQARYGIKPAPRPVQPNPKPEVKPDKEQTKKAEKLIEDFLTADGMKEKEDKAVASLKAIGGAAYTVVKKKLYEGRAKLIELKVKITQTTRDGDKETVAKLEKEKDELESRVINLSALQKMIKSGSSTTAPRPRPQPKYGIRI